MRTSSALRSIRPSTQSLLWAIALLVLQWAQGFVVKKIDALRRPPGL